MEWTKQDTIRYEIKKLMLDFHSMPELRQETDLETRTRHLLEEILKNDLI